MIFIIHPAMNLQIFSNLAQKNIQNFLGYSHSNSVYFAISAHRNVVHDPRRYNTLAIMSGACRSIKRPSDLFLLICTLQSLKKWADSLTTFTKLL